MREGKSRPTRATHPPEVVDPVWLVKAFVVMLLLALVCAYLTLCGLFFRGQWQLVLHPSRTAATPSTVSGTEAVRFGAAATGLPQLTGCWIPAAPGARFQNLTLLYLHGGDGSLANDQATLADLHNLGMSIFAVEYRGFGQSADLHPSQQSMTEDTDQAWTYLTSSRGLQPGQIVPYGRGLGASLALHLATEMAATPAVILDDPDFDVEQRARRDPRSSLVPFGLLFRNRFPLFPALDELKTPKLILSRDAQEDSAILRAADPKMTVALPPASPGSAFPDAVSRFLDQYIPAAGPHGLVPTPAP